MISALSYIDGGDNYGFEYNFIGRKARMRRQARRQKRQDEGRLGPKKVLLLPLVPAMKFILKRRNVTPRKGIAELAEQFYFVVIRKDPDYTGAFAVELATIITAIVSFFKTISKKDKQKTQLTGEENGVMHLLRGSASKLENGGFYQDFGKGKSNLRIEVDPTNPPPVAGQLRLSPAIIGIGALIAIIALNAASKKKS